MICFIENKENKEDIARKILGNLPEWFGLPDSTEEYIIDSKEMPFWADIADNKVRGFVTLKETSPYVIEIYVMGILKEFHRKNIGSKLFESCYKYAKEREYLYMQVKTVKEGCYEEYDITNKFYKKLEFEEFECFPTLWDKWNPCQIYIMYLK